MAKSRRPADAPRWVMPADPDLPLIFTRADALAAGASRHQVARRAHTGRWRTLRRGIYVEERRYAALSARDQHLVAVQATLMARGGRSPQLAASHLSAAAVYGWALPLEGPGPATLTNGDVDAPTRHTADLVVQVAGLPPRDLTTRTAVIDSEKFRLPLTSPARTVADNLRHLRNADGVALADSALRQGRVAFDQVAACLDRQGLWPYAENGRRALLLLDPRRETWLESYSFVTLHRLGLPMPVPQVTLFDRRGRKVARVEGWLEDQAVVLEADGREKYFLDDSRLPADLDNAADDLPNRVRRRLIEEKERQDRIGDLGAQISRWGTSDITRKPRTVLERVDAARRRGDRASFTGRTAYLPSPAWLAD